PCAATPGAGPLIGPVLAIQYGFMPGLLWLVIGVCLAGAVQDMLVLAASVRRGGRSLAEIARTELGKPAAIVVSAAILFIVIIALAGLGYVVVKALGGEEIKLAEGTQIKLPPGTRPEADTRKAVDDHYVLTFPAGCQIRYQAAEKWQTRPESFQLQISQPPGTARSALPSEGKVQDGQTITLPSGIVQLVPGSSWGTFTIACTIPIALLVGLYMYKIRKGRVVEASLIGAAGVLAATVIGNW